MSDSIINEFDKRVASIWLVIALGAGKAIEQSVGLLAEHWVSVMFLGVDVTALALYITLTTAGTTALIFWRTL